MIRYRASQSNLAQPIALWFLVLCAVAILAAVVTLTGGRELYLGAPDPDELARQIEAAMLPSR